MGVERRRRQVGGSGTGTGSGGTGTGGGGGTGTTTVAGAAFLGVVTAAGKPVAGATVQVFGAGTTGAGMGATAFESTALMTDANGAFSVAAGYACAASTTQVYVTARGGRVGTAASGNAALAEMTVLGPCGGIASGATVAVDEATTVAAVWALDQFLAADGTIGASATNGTGLQERGADGAGAGEYDGRNGAALILGVGEGADREGEYAGEFAERVHGGWGIGWSAAVLAGATAAGGTAPADTLAAARAIARTPAANVAALYGAEAGMTTYSPGLTAAPLDWMLTLTYAGGGLLNVDGPTALAIDASGNAWVRTMAGWCQRSRRWVCAVRERHYGGRVERLVRAGDRRQRERVGDECDE